MARPAKKSPEQWKSEIMRAAGELFLSRGYEETTVTDIMEKVGGAKGMFYRYFDSKEEIMQAIGDKMFFENNPFDAIKKRTDLNGLQKIRELLVLNQSDTERDSLNTQAIPILKDPRILQTAIEANKRILTPLWFELLEEARTDGSIQTKYTKELSELLPLVNFWLMPSVYPATAKEIQHKYLFVIEVLAKMGLPIMDDKTTVAAEKFLRDIAPKQKD